jgi:hypothetical protein
VLTCLTMPPLVEFREDLAVGEDWVLGALPNRKQRLAEAARSRRVEARRAAVEVRNAAREVGADIWSVKDAADLADLLDASVDDAMALGRARKVQSALFRRQIDALPDASSFARGIHGKMLSDGGGILPDFLEGVRLVSTVVELIDRHDTQARSSEPVPWEAIDDHALPISVLHAWLAAERGFICLAALVDLVLSDRPSPQTWLLRRVVRGWVDGQRAVLRIVAMLHGDAGVSEDLLPAADRLDRDAVVRAHDEGEAVFEQLIAGSVGLAS